MRLFRGRRCLGVVRERRQRVPAGVWRLEAGHLGPRNHGLAPCAGLGGRNGDILRGCGVGLYQSDAASLHCNTAAPGAALS
jgi:hypothetical protein